MVATITGTAHPPPSANPRTIADFNAAEIATTARSLDLSKDLPVLVEHEGGPRGTVLSSWEGPRGELRIMAKVDDPEAERQLHSGELSELSLGTFVTEVGTKVCRKRVQEVSLVEKGARHNCIIDYIDDKRVGCMVNASKRSHGGVRLNKYIEEHSR